MAQYIDKADLVAEIERRISQLESKYKELSNVEIWITAKEIKHKINGLKEALSIVNTLEVKDANEALRTEYEKGRADVIADTLSWLENCWPRYCSNQTIIEGFKEAMKE